MLIYGLSSLTIVPAVKPICVGKRGAGKPRGKENMTFGFDLLLVDVSKVSFLF
jgi:hypothetical protein